MTTSNEPVFTAANLTEDDIRAVWYDNSKSLSLESDCRLALHFKLAPETLEVARARIAAYLNSKMPASARRCDCGWQP